MTNLTNKQIEVLNFISVFIKNYRFSPTIREIAKHYQMSVNGAYDHVKALEKKGKIHWTQKKARTIEILEEVIDDEA